MNPVIELLNARWAGRAIEPDKPIPESALQDLTEAARLTPSCYNKQPWRFLFLQSPEALEKGRGALAGGNRAWAVKAPLLIVAYSRPQDDCQLPDGREYHQFDLGMSVMNIMLAAAHHHLAARPMAGFNPAKIKGAFSLEDDCKPLVMIAAGYPSPDESHLPEYYRGLADKHRQRKPVSEIVQYL